MRGVWGFSAARGIPERRDALTPWLALMNVLNVQHGDGGTEL